MSGTVSKTDILAINEEIKWGAANCAKYKDMKDKQTSDKNKNLIQSWIDACERMKGMHDMEYTSFIFDIVIGFVCGLLGLLHLFEVKKDFVANIGLIGLICGMIGFSLTFVYVIFNGLIFTGKYSDEFERESDGYYAERKGTTTDFQCIASVDEEDVFSGFAKFSDLNKKQYNYKKDFYDNSKRNCICPDSDVISLCNTQEILELNDYSTCSNIDGNSCKYIYATAKKDNSNKDIFDKFLTTLILSLIVCLANLGLILSGFLLFRTPGDF